MNEWRWRLPVTFIVLGLLSGSGGRAEEKRPGAGRHNVQLVASRPCLVGVSYHHMASSPVQGESKMPPMPDDVFKSGVWNRAIAVPARIVYPDPATTPAAFSEQTGNGVRGLAVLVPDGESVVQTPAEAHSSLPPPPAPSVAPRKAPEVPASPSCRSGRVHHVGWIDRAIASARRMTVHFNGPHHRAARPAERFGAPRDRLTFKADFVWTY